MRGNTKEAPSSPDSHSCPKLKFLFEERNSLFSCGGEGALGTEDGGKGEAPPGTFRLENTRDTT